MLVGDGEVVSPSPHPKIERISRPPVEAAWLDDELAILERLVEEGDTLELVGALSRIVRDPKRVSDAVALGRRLGSRRVSRRRIAAAELTTRPARAPTAAGRASARDRARTTLAARRLLREHERIGVGQLGAAVPSAISPSSTAPIVPAKVVHTGVPSATASRFIVPPAETTRSARAIRL